MRKLIKVYNQKIPTKNIKIQWVIECSIFKTWLKIVCEFPNLFIHQEKINLNNS